jgi:hypothetical protein
MDDNRTPKRILQWKPIGTRTRGRPRRRWIASIEKDLQIMGGRQWRKQCEERAEWKKITENAKPTVGCNTSKRKNITVHLIILIITSFFLPATYTVSTLLFHTSSEVT